jgi:hypothetical protein
MRLLLRAAVADAQKGLPCKFLVFSEIEGEHRQGAPSFAEKKALPGTLLRPRTGS